MPASLGPELLREAVYAKLSHVAYLQGASFRLTANNKRSIAKPIIAAMIISATSRSVCIIVCALTIEYPKPALVAMNSAQMTDIHPAESASRIPVSTSGAAPGITTLRMTLARLAPMLLAA